MSDALVEHPEIQPALRSLVLELARRPDPTPIVSSEQHQSGSGNVQVTGGRDVYVNSTINRRRYLIAPWMLIINLARAAAAHPVVAGLTLAAISAGAAGGVILSQTSHHKPSASPPISGGRLSGDQPRPALPPAVYVATQGGEPNYPGTVTLIDTTTNKPSKPISVGNGSSSIATTPDGRTAYIASAISNTVTPINTATRVAGKPIIVGRRPEAIAISPDGKTVYVVDNGTNTVTAINTATNKIQTIINVGIAPVAIAVTPNGKTAYVVNSGSGNVTPINISTNQPGQKIPVGNGPLDIAIAPNGKVAYVGGNTLTPINLATNTAGSTVSLGGAGAGFIAITPNSKTAYIVDTGVPNGSGDFTTSSAVTPVNTSTNTPGTPIKVGVLPQEIVITPNGKTAYVDGQTGTLTPITIATGRPRNAVQVGDGSALTMTITPNGKTIYVTDQTGTVTPVATATNTAGKLISVGLAGGSASAIAIAP